MIKSQVEINPTKKEDEKSEKAKNKEKPSDKDNMKSDSEQDDDSDDSEVVDLEAMTPEERRAYLEKQLKIMEEREATSKQI